MNILARPMANVRIKVWIVQNNLHIAETYTKGTRTERNENFEAEMKLHTAVRT